MPDARLALQMRIGAGCLFLATALAAATYVPVPVVGGDNKNGPVSPLRHFFGHSDGVWGIAFTPDGERAVTASFDGTARVWEVSTGRQLGVFSGHTAGVLSVAVSADGQWAATGSADRTVRVWNLATCAETMVFKGHAGAVNAVAFLPDGRSVLSAGADCVLR